VIASYYAWYGLPTGPTGYWYHWVDSNGQPLVTDHPNFLYDSRDPDLITYHLTLASYVGIDAFAVSWWGQGSPEDSAFSVMLTTAAGSSLPVKLAAQFETPKFVSAGAVGITSQLSYILKSYSGKSSYLRVAGRPVVFIYNPAAFSTNYDQWATILASPTIASFNAFFVGDSFTDEAARVFDGLYTFAPFGPSYPYAPTDLFNKYKAASAVARQHSRLFIPAVAPGFDDHVIRTPSTLIPRNDAWTYMTTWLIATAASPDWVFIDSWNEWHEGTELEPSAEYGRDYLYLTAQWTARFKGS
jgi:hypothetical protein